MQYHAEVTIELKSGMLDPEGTTIKRALKHLGYQTESVTTAKKYMIKLDSNSADSARQMVDEMCQKLIANPIIHNYTIVIGEFK
ncbi:MAG: phosphoribosylformylglycinamidine synthase subunit PurS [Methanosarcinaceae archaeon]